MKRVVLMAPSETGKTSLLTGAYAYLASRASPRFGLEITSAAGRARLNNFVAMLQKGSGKERFEGIHATNEVETYPAAIDWKTPADGVGSQKLPITIVDLPGGVFALADTTASDPKSAKLIEDVNAAIQSADIFLVVAPFDLVYQRKEHDFFQDIQLGLSQIRSALFSEYERRRSSWTPGRPMNVIVALTRADRLDRMIQANSEKERLMREEIMSVLGERAREFMNAAFAGLMKQDNIQFFLVATSLGADIEGQGRFNPLRVDLPFIYAGWRAMLAEADDLEIQQKANEASAKTCADDARRKRSLAADKDREASRLRSEAEAAKKKWLRDTFLRKGKKLSSEADDVDNSARLLRHEAGELDSRQSSHLTQATQNKADRAAHLRMATDAADLIRTSLSDNCYIVRGGHYMRASDSNEDAHLLTLVRGPRVDDLRIAPSA